MAHDDDRRLAAFLDELEQAATAGWAAERDLEVTERARAEYARVTLAARLMATLDSQVDLVVQGIGPVAGELVRVANGWCLVETTSAGWLVLLDAVEIARGLDARAVAPEAWPVTARLGLGSALRGLAGERSVVRLRSGTQLEGRIGRAGADFVELHLDAGPPLLVAYAALAAVRR